MIGSAFMRSWCLSLRAKAVPVEGGSAFRVIDGGDAQGERVSGKRWFDRVGWGILRERLGRGVLNAGLPGALGVLLVLVAVLAAFFGRVANDERRAAIDAERVRLTHVESQPVAATDERAQLNAFFDRFPPVADLPAGLRRLNEHAAAHGIRLQRTDYSSTAVAGTPLTQVSLALPVEGDAGALYAWLAALLQEMPEVALESVTLKRASPETKGVEADIRLQLYLRGRS